MTKRPVRAKPRKPHPGDLIKETRELAEQGRISYTRHALEDQMPDRGFDVVDVEYVLMTGMIEGEITPGKNPDEWKCLVVNKVSLDSREVGVATVVVRQRRLIIITVEWIDP